MFINPTVQDFEPMSKCRYSVLRKAAITLTVGAAFCVGMVVSAPQTRAADQEAVIAEGSTALQRGEFAEAVAQFTAALDSNELSPETTAVTHLNRGLSYQRLNRMVEAIADYDYALQQNTLSPAVRAVALYNRGLANRRLYRTTLALEDFTNALILNPRFAQAYNSRANILRELGYYGTAVEDYAAAVRLEHPQLHIPLYGQALAHAALNDVASAQRVLARALVINPDYEPARTLLTRITTQPASDDTSTVIANNVDAVQTGTVNTASTEVERTPAPFSDEAASANNQYAELAQSDVVASPAGATIVPGSANGQTSVVVVGPGFELEDLDNNTADTTTTASVTPASTAPVAPAAAAAPVQGYLIQISAQRDEGAAQDLWNQLADRHTDILGGLTPYIVEADLGSRGIFYRIRAGDFETRDAGDRVCRSLQSRRVECFVVAAGN